MHELDRRLAPTFASQLSLVTRRQVRAVGGDDAAIRRRLRNGRWELAERGVYGLTGVGWSWRRNLAAVVLSIPRGTASHRAAAALLDVRWDDRAVAPIEVSVPGHASPARDFGLTRERWTESPIVIHEQLDSGRIPSRPVDGIATTPPLRLAVDLGAVVPFDRYRRAMSQLRKKYGVEWVELERVYRRHSKQGRDGCGALRDLLDLHFGAEGAPDEVIEIRCADLLRAAGLPTPVHQYEVVRPDGRRAYFDLAYPDLRVAIETDGRVHGDDEVREWDNRRRNNVQLLGWTVLHFTWEDVMRRPQYVVSMVRATLEAAAA